MHTYEELMKWSDEDLEDLGVRGTNNYVHNSGSAIALRILTNRRQKKEVEAAEKTLVIAEQVQASQKEISNIAADMEEVVGILKYVRKHWLPNRPLWQKVTAFIFTGVVLSFGINLASQWFATNVLKWP